MIKIVICDEDNGVLQEAEQLLKGLGAGYELHAFTGWADCLDFMRRQRTDLLLCEMRFKDMTGPQLAAETYAVRACDYLLKPLDERKLLRALQKCKIQL